MRKDSLEMLFSNYGSQMQRPFIRGVAKVDEEGLFKTERDLLMSKEIKAHLPPGTK